MREWLVIENSMKNGIFVSAEVRDEKGYIPRDVAEAICGRSMAGPQWFTREESEKMRAHPEWRDTEPPPLTESTRPPMNDDLIARLERATEGSRELDAEIYLCVGKIAPEKQAVWDAPIPLLEYAKLCVDWHGNQFTRNLAAAESLVPKAPRGEGWFWRAGRGSVNPGWAHLNKYDASNCNAEDEVTAYAATPALALCIAALKARGWGWAANHMPSRIRASTMSATDTRRKTRLRPRAHPGVRCEGCDGLYFRTINWDGRYGPLFPGVLPCLGCHGTGKQRG